MAENEGRGGAAPELATDDGEYEIDMDKHSSGDLDAAFQEAVEAVEREGKDDSSDAGDGDAGVGAEAGEDAASVEDQLRERLLRTLADFDNYRKRAEREKRTLRRMGTFDVLKDSLGVIDNLERALEAGGGVEDLKQGLKLVLRQFEEFLRRHGAEKIAAEGEVFDPAVHEAVARQESDEIDEPTVVAELQRGYLFHDRLLRPAMVHVAMPAPSAAEKERPEAAGEPEGGEEPAAQEDRPQDDRGQVEEAVD